MWDLHALVQNLRDGAGSKFYGMYFSIHGRRNCRNFMDFLLFVPVNGKNAFHIALNQRHPLVFGTVRRRRDYRKLQQTSFVPVDEDLCTNSDRLPIG
jgi:hypothetical protein